MRRFQNAFLVILTVGVQVFFSNAVFSQTASGFVFNDINKNGIRDKGEFGIPDVCVSNGVEVVQTNAKGKWKLSVSDDTDIFVIKPAGYSVPVNENMVPQYYYLNKPGGSPELKVKGVNPTGKLPRSIDFPLTPSDEKDIFTALFFGDTQASRPEEVHYINHDVVEELIGSDAEFGVVLGDIVGHDPSLFREISAGIAQIGTPWYYIFGNHDSNHDASENKYRDETFERFFGPSTYAFEVGMVIFVGFNNIYFNEEGKYHGRFLPEQVQFLRNYLRFVPDDKLVVLMMHVPIFRCENKEQLFEILEKRSHTFSVSGHVHEQLDVFVDKKYGWHGKEPHHHLINATVCGSWWCGLKDEVGIPHATMNDGAPNGYSFITFNGNNYKVRFKAARRPADYQMNIYLPDKISVDSLGSIKVKVNVFAGNERSVVKMKVDRNGEWMKMMKKELRDPEIKWMHDYTPLLKLEYNGEPVENTLGWPMDNPSISRHMWEGQLSSDLNSGVHTLTVQIVDMYGQTWKAHKVFYVE